MTTTTRRAILAGLAAAPVAGLPALAQGGELPALIEAYRSAHDAFLVVVDELEKIEDAWDEAHGAGFQVESLLGGDCGSRNGHERCKENIARGYDHHRERVVNIERLDPELGERLRSVLDAKEAENMALIDKAFEQEDERKEAFGLGPIQRRWAELGNAEEAAAMSLCGYQCRTLDEARIKAAAILESPMIMYALDQGYAAALLQSFVGGDVEATA